MYKDKDKQREANKRSKERWQAKQADIAVREALGIPPEGIPQQGIPPIENKGIPKRGKDIKSFVDMMSLVDGKIDQTIKANRTAIAIDYQHKHPDRYHSTGAVFTGKMTVMERLFYRPGQRNFVSLPSRACYGVCQ